MRSVRVLVVSVSRVDEMRRVVRLSEAGVSVVRGAGLCGCCRRVARGVGWGQRGFAAFLRVYGSCGERGIGILCN